MKPPYSLLPASCSSGFTLVELIICVTIFVMMTALLVANYGTFNQSTLLTDLAYDTAITLRTAQTYGISVQSASQSTQDFNIAYGVHFDTASGDSYAGNTQFSIFPDNNLNGIFEPVSQTVPLIYADTPVQSTYTLTHGGQILSGGLCVGNGASCTTTVTSLDISFRRPNPEAIIYANGNNVTAYQYAAITITGTDEATRTVQVQGNGEISVEGSD